MWNTVGHHKAINFLGHTLRTGKFFHSYLIVGPPRIGKMTLALDLASALNCSGESKPCGECRSCIRIADKLHADVQIVGLDLENQSLEQGGVSIKIDHIRNLKRESSLKPFEGDHRVFILDCIEDMKEEASSSLLKILEEPPGNVVLILLTSNITKVLSTIASRCQLLELTAIPKGEIIDLLKSTYKCDDAVSDQIARLSSGRLGWAIDASRHPEMLEDLQTQFSSIEAVVSGNMEHRFNYATYLADSYSKNRITGRNELRIWLMWWRDVLLAKEGTQELISNLSGIDRIRRMASDLSSSQIIKAIIDLQDVTQYLESNVSPRLALQNLMLILPVPH